MKFRCKLHKYKVIVRISENVVITYTVKGFSMQEARYKIIQKEGCSNKDILSVIPTN